MTITPVVFLVYCSVYQECLQHVYSVVCNFIGCWMASVRSEQHKLDSKVAPGTCLVVTPQLSIPIPTRHLCIWHSYVIARRWIRAFRDCICEQLLFACVRGWKRCVCVCVCVCVCMHACVCVCVLACIWYLFMSSAECFWIVWRKKQEYMQWSLLGLQTQLVGWTSRHVGKALMSWFSQTP